MANKWQAIVRVTWADMAVVLGAFGCSSSLKNCQVWHEFTFDGYSAGICNFHSEISVWNFSLDFGLDFQSKFSSQNFSNTIHLSDLEAFKVCKDFSNDREPHQMLECSLANLQLKWSNELFEFGDVVIGDAEAVDGEIVDGKTVDAAPIKVQSTAQSSFKSFEPTGLWVRPLCPRCNSETY